MMEFHEHFELAQDSKRCQLEAELSENGTHVKRILSTKCECDQSKYMRISSNSFPNDLEGEQLRAVSEVCLRAFHLEELNFLINVNATNQWLRTVIGHEDLHPTTWTESNNELLSKIVMHSNIVPYDPYWSNRFSQRDGANFMRVHFPSCILREALSERKTLAAKLQEWMCIGENYLIGKDRQCEELRTSKLLWEIQEGDVDPVKELAKDIWVVTWNGSRFVQKETLDNSELEVVQRLSHPHIVYSLGELCGGSERAAYFMEYMSNDLRSFIIDRKREVGVNKPPFLPHDSIEVLLQIAKAMEYMHGERVNLVHCDLKSMNVFISEIAISESVKHYLVKVADFGSARSGNASRGSTGFIAGPGTTLYMAPEALLQQHQQRKHRLEDRTICIRFPHKIDVYSFGIIAFEVLTGDIEYCKSAKRSPSAFKSGVMDGKIRPRLREECQRSQEFNVQDELKLLIESCWHSDASQRPSFVDIVAELNRAKDRLSKASLLDHLYERQWHGTDQSHGKQQGIVNQHPDYLLA